MADEKARVPLGGLLQMLETTRARKAATEEALKRYSKREAELIEMVAAEKAAVQAELDAAEEAGA